MLTSSQLNQFHQEGFIVVENLATYSECDALRNRAIELVQDFDISRLKNYIAENTDNTSWEDYYYKKQEKICFFFEKEAFLPDGSLRFSKELSIQKISYALHLEDQIFKEFVNSAKLSLLIAELGVKDPLILQSMFLFKQPYIGGPVACHQDSSFLYTEPDSLIGIWVALEDASKENGCLWVIPEGHNSPLKFRSTRNQKGEVEYEIFDDTPWELHKMKPIEVSKGTAIIMHGRLPHMSLENHSSKSRHAFSVHLISQRSFYPNNNWLKKNYIK